MMEKMESQGSVATLPNAQHLLLRTVDQQPICGTILKFHTKLWLIVADFLSFIVSLFQHTKAVGLKEERQKDVASDDKLQLKLTSFEDAKAARKIKRDRAFAMMIFFDLRFVSYVSVSPKGFPISAHTACLRHLLLTISSSNLTHHTTFLQGT
jgi:hypothetical protein